MSAHKQLETSSKRGHWWWGLDGIPAHINNIDYSAWKRLCIRGLEQWRALTGCDFEVEVDVVRTRLACVQDSRIVFISHIRSDALSRNYINLISIILPRSQDRSITVINHLLLKWHIVIKRALLTTSYLVSAIAITSLHRIKLAGTMTAL